MVDAQKVDQLLTKLRSYLKELRRLAASDRQPFLSDQDMIGNAKYHFIIAIEACIDIANHIISSQRLRPPKSYGDSFVILSEEKIIAQEQKTPLLKMAKFRNRLVHMYWEVENQLLRNYLEHNLQDFDNFIKSISQYLKQQS